MRSGLASANIPLREAMVSESTQSPHPLIIRQCLENSVSRIQARIEENEREPRSSQERNMKSDELHELAFQQTNALVAAVQGRHTTNCDSRRIGKPAHGTDEKA